MRKPSWLQSIIREAGFRQGIVVYGNVNDNCFKNNRYKPFFNVLIEELQDKKFNLCVGWNRVEGVVFPSKEQESKFCNILDESMQGEIEIEGGDDYDLEEKEDEVLPKNQKPQYLEPSEFFPIVYRIMKKESVCPAFIFNFSDFIFGNQNSLSEQERLWLVQLAKSLYEKETNLSLEEIENPSGLIVLITTNLGSIPPSFYQNQSVVKTFCIPLPNRQERAEFFRSHREVLLLDEKTEKQIQKLSEITEDLNFRDLQQVLKLSRQNQESLSPEKLINLYRFGEQISPWEDLEREQLSKLEEILKDRVIGQEHAVERVVSMVIRAFMGLAGLQHSEKRSKPKGSLFFVGPTGVGKTELAKATASFLFGDESACIRFDMSEFNHEHSDQRLVGAPPGYVGFEEGGQLTNAVKSKPFCVLLFDEIEKAHPRVLDKFLQILEDGRLTDGKGETVYFSETVIIFTSNLGASEVSPGTEFKEQKKEFITFVREHFNKELKRPELLNRFGDNIIPFRFIQDENLREKIVEAKLKPLVLFLQEKYQLSLEFAEPQEAYKSIVNQADVGHGGRGLINVIERKVIDPLSEYLFKQGDRITGKKIRLELLPTKKDFEFELSDA